MPEPVFTVANQLTMLRMALVPAFVLLVLAREFSWALVVFVVAGLTDALDGYVARHANQSTRLGAMLDPVADKLLAGSAYVVLTWSSVVSCAIPVWLTVTLLFRDAHDRGRGGGGEPDGGPSRVLALAAGQGLDGPQHRDRRRRPRRERHGRLPGGPALALRGDAGRPHRLDGSLRLPGQRAAAAAARDPAQTPSLLRK